MKKINYEFLTLQFLAIVFVVAGHSGVDTPFAGIFPVYSFHMPLFVFISGYFWKNNTKVRDYLLKIFKKFLIPLLIWNTIYTLIAQVLRHFGIISFGLNIGLDSMFLNPITNRAPSLNISVWFVSNLILVSVTYILLKKLLDKLIKNEYIITVIIFIVSLVATQYSMSNNLNLYYDVICRILMQLFYFQIGYLYKIKLEAKDKLNSISYFLIVLLIQFIVLIRYDKIYSVVVSMSFPYNFSLVAFVVALTGIAFWLRVAKLITPITKDSKVINYIGQNTWTVMMHHQFIIFAINAMVYLITIILSLNIKFRPEEFSYNPWYIYLTEARGPYGIVYVILGIGVPLLLKYYYDKYKESR